MILWKSYLSTLPLYSFAQRTSPHFSQVLLDITATTFGGVQDPINL